MSVFRRSQVASISMMIATIWLGSGWLFYPAQGQDINGIFFPRSSEEFFLDGVRRLESEVQQLEQSLAYDGDRPLELEIDESISVQQDEREQSEQWIFEHDRMDGGGLRPASPGNRS